MNKQVLSPFDCDMCAMIEDITKQEIEVTASDTSIRLSWAQNGSDGNDTPEAQRIEALKQGGEVVGNRTRVKIVKNKVAPPFREAEFDIMFGQGISREGDILDLAADKGVVNKSGAWYAYNGDKIGQGRENAKQYLKENPLICEEIEAKVREMLNVDGTEESEETKENETEAQSIKAAEAIAKKAEAAEKKAENTAEVKAEE